MDKNGWVFAGADVLRRAWVLYIAHIFLFVVFSAQVSYSATALDRSDYLEEIHIDALADAPYRAMLEALLLHFQPAYLDILPMYIALLVVFAFVMPLLRVRWLLLALVGRAPMSPSASPATICPSWTGGGWYFNPIAWQFLFIIGATLSYRPFQPAGPQAPVRHPAPAVILRRRPGSALAGVARSRHRRRACRSGRPGSLSQSTNKACIPCDCCRSLHWCGSWCDWSQKGRNGCRAAVRCRSSYAASTRWPCSALAYFSHFWDVLRWKSDRTGWFKRRSTSSAPARSSASGALAAWYRRKGAAARATLPAAEPARSAGAV